MAKKNSIGATHISSDNQIDESTKPNNKKKEKIQENISTPKKEKKRIVVTENLKSPINQHIIDVVRIKRKAIKLSQTKLAIAVGFTESFVGHCENPNRPEKYNADHINILAVFFKCSPKEFLPDAPYEVSSPKTI